MSGCEVHSLFPHSQSEVHGAAQTCFNRSASTSRHQRETSVAADGSTRGPKRMGIERPGMKLDLVVVNCVDSDSSFHLPECHSFICEMAVVTPVLIPSHNRLGGCIHSMYVIPMTTNPCGWTPHGECCVVLATACERQVLQDVVPLGVS